MIGKMPIDIAKQYFVLAWQFLDQPRQNLARRSVAVVPHDAQAFDALIILQKTGDIVFAHIDAFRLALPNRERAFFGGFGQCLDLVAVNRPAARKARCHQHLEPVLIRRIVRTRHHDPAVGIRMISGKVKHRRGAKADPIHIHARG